MKTMVNEGNAVIQLPHSDETLSKKMPVFYNPVMKHNRDVSILLLKSIPDKHLAICDPLAGTGIRAIRFLKELPAEKVRRVYFNDKNPTAVEYIEKNLRLNKIKRKFEVCNKDANLMLRECKGFDYIDIDPFGSPNPFLDAAVQSLSRNGILAITATDTSALCGSSPKACLRKYWANPLHNYLMHEVGLRILVRKVQLIGAQYAKALEPIYSYSKDHYMRVFFRMQKGKSRVDSLLKKHSIFQSAGPMWLGPLWDTRLARLIAGQACGVDNDLARMIRAIAEESRLDLVGYCDLHEFCKRHRLVIPRNEGLLAGLGKAGYGASVTHFSPHGIRCDVPEKELMKIIRRL
jgi:tRNA (guanine26-N2/guanine27-N2)-dimethyltransferase